MTMADTVAVMHAGRIEQLGHPADVYETPRTVFVANFLGQSNLIVGEKIQGGESVEVNAHGVRFTMPGSRNFAPGSQLVVGVRPEKMIVLDLADAGRIPSGQNTLHGTVTDVSYTGVSTQYLVLTAWGQQVIAFEQNSIVGDRCAVGDPVVLHWSPQHTFGLDPAGGLSSGIDPSVLALESDAEA